MGRHYICKSQTQLEIQKIFLLNRRVGYCDIHSTHQGRKSRFLFLVLIDTEVHGTPVDAASMEITPGNEETLERAVIGMMAGYAPQESSSGQI